MQDVIIPHFNRQSREDWIRTQDGNIFDVAIIGGGITGAGVANILSQNGIKVILLERNDFGSGTSSGSSKLIHGGLRYLAELRFREVKILLKERDYLAKNTDIVKYMNFRILIDPYSWKKWTMRTGLFIYNILSRRIKVPKMNKNNGEYGKEVRGYFTYRDAFSDDCRLTIYNIASSVRHGAKCLNYCEVQTVSLVGNCVELGVLDKAGNKKFKVRAGICINAAGPWSGNVYKNLENGDNVRLKLSKGVHIVVPREKAPTEDAIVFRSHLDRRQMFIIPRGEVTIIGTTDNFVDDPDDFNVSDKDVDYIIKSAQRIFKGLERNDITYSYAGIRPLYGNGDDPGSISRGLTIRHDEHFINIFGGKLTDYRSAARKVARVYEKLSGRKISLKNMPVIDYSRPELTGEELYRYEMEYECAMFPEDITRRREAFDVYRKDRGVSEHEIINRIMGVKKSL
jgi:glycerol-3-phosphate dehydrogenase